MFRFVLVLTLAILANGFSSSKDAGLEEFSSRIVGGYEIEITQKKFQVLLLITSPEGTFICGGSILSARWVLTAAHCLTGGVTAVEVRAGTSYLASGGVSFKTPKYRIHPLYNGGTHDYDIAVVDLMANVLPLNGNTIAAVKLAAAGSTVATNTPVLVSGWGTTSENGNVSNKLMEVQVNIVSQTQCRQSYSTITSRMICAGVPGGGKDSCQGDSGGPLVLSNGTQVGVVSFGIGCARPNYPGVYSNIGNLRSWIKTNTGI